MDVCVPQSSLVQREEHFVHSVRGQDEDFTLLLEQIKVCTKNKNLCEGSRIHAYLVKRGLLQKDIYLSTALVGMYAKCAALGKAQELFYELPACTVVTWTTLIAGYAKQGCSDEALNCYQQMQDVGLSPDGVTFTSILKACASIRAVEKGGEIHIEVSRKGLLEKDMVLGTALMDMYAKCGVLTKAQEVFDGLSARDVVTWNALLSGYAQNELGDQALSCFKRMQEEGICPDNVTYICSLKACGSMEEGKKGEEIHAKICGQKALLENDVVLGTALVDMYAKCHMLAKAQLVFDELLVRNVVTWNALIAGCAQHGLADEALSCYGRMQEEGLAPDAATFIAIFEACGCTRAVKEGEEVHAQLHKQGLLERNVSLGNALVDMYMKFGALRKAQEVFDELAIRDVVAWTALMTGYAEQGQGDEALRCLLMMQKEGLFPNAVTFMCLLKACGTIGAVKKGEDIHSQVGSTGLLGREMGLGNALIDMYMSFGAFARAQEVFNELPTRDIVTWNALITGYAHIGYVKKMFDSYDRMLGANIQPDGVTFLVLLPGCSHAGLMEEAHLGFHSMTLDYFIVPMPEHYNGMVDLFSRAGQGLEVLSIIEKMPPCGSPSTSLAVVDACRLLECEELWRYTFEVVDENLSALYVCMSNMYVAASM